MKAPGLNAEQRRALTMLVTAGPNGVAQALLSVHGFGVSLLAGLVNRGLATMMYERVGASGKMIEVRITERGRDALGES